MKGRGKGLVKGAMGVRSLSSSRVLELGFCLHPITDACSTTIHYCSTKMGKKKTN